MYENEGKDGYEGANAGGAGEDDSNIEEELGKRVEGQACGSVAASTDLDIDDIPNPKNLAEAEDELKYLKNVLKSLKKEYEDSNLNYLKSLADLENFRKRMNREKEESLKYSNEKLLRDLLPVLDFLDLAIGHSEYYLEQDSSGNLKSFVDGVKLAYGEFVKILKNNGVAAIETSGKNFDANFHEAVEIVGDLGQPDGKIIEEKRKGYVYKERLLRPSMVSIVKSRN